MPPFIIMLLAAVALVVVVRFLKDEFLITMCILLILGLVGGAVISAGSTRRHSEQDLAQALEDGAAQTTINLAKESGNLEDVATRAFTQAYTGSGTVDIDVEGRVVTVEVNGHEVATWRGGKLVSRCRQLVFSTGGSVVLDHSC